MKYAILILRYLKGYVTFEVSGGFFERFFNLCTIKRINIRDIKREGKKIYASTSASEFRKIREPVRKSGVKLRLISKKGLIFDLKKCNKRTALIFGFIFFIVFHIIMNQFVWAVDVKGNNKISRSELIEKAELQGLSFSTNIRTFDEIKASRNIAADYDGKVSWLSINIKGSLAVIELRENEINENKITDMRPCNIVAGFDGVIISTEVFKGDLMTTVGNGVRKGDLLISGAIINEDMSTTFYHADGKITALHNEKQKIQLNSNKNLLKLTNSRNRKSFNILNVNIPLRFVSYKNSFKDAYFLNINGYSLPFGYSQEYEINEKESNIDYVNNIICCESVMYEIYKKHRNSTIISKSEKIEKEKNGSVYIGDYTVIDFIGEEKAILSDNLK